MCFSATASFTASAVLGVIGVLLIRKVRSKNLLLLAFIPLAFAIQQFSEGIVWLYLPNQAWESIPNIAKNVFLFFAFAFWPIWIPLSFWLPEQNIARKNALAICLGIGIALGSSLILTIPSFVPVFRCCSINYSFEIINSNISLLEKLNILAFTAYGIATLLPLFLSSIKKTWIVGVLVTLSAIITYWIDVSFFISMWCFFAAIFSAGLFFILKKTQTP